MDRTRETQPPREESGAALLSDARLRILAEVSQTFAMAATDYDSLLEKIAKSTSQLIGDGCAVTLVDAGGTQLVNAANAHRDPDIATIYRQYLDGMGVSKMSSPSVSANVARTGLPAFQQSVDPAQLVARSEASLRPLVARLDVHSYAVVPIRAHGTVLGTLSLMRTGPGRDYVPEDVVLLQDLADRAGLAIDNARLYRDLEERVRQRTAELEVFSHAIANSVRAPLRRIAAFSESLDEDIGGSLNPQSRLNLDRIRASVGRLNSTIEGLLHLSQLEETSLRPIEIDLTALVHELVARLRESEPERSVEVSVEAAMQITADRRLVELWFGALLGNAWAATRAQAGARIHVSTERSKTSLAIVVGDNASGILLEQARAILRAERTSPSEAMSDFALGLIIARQTLRRLGGTIDVVAGDDAAAHVRCVVPIE